MATQVLSCGLIKDWKTRYYHTIAINTTAVVVWLKIGKHDIFYFLHPFLLDVVVWLKIGKHDIKVIYNTWAC